LFAETYFFRGFIQGQSQRPDQGIQDLKEPLKQETRFPCYSNTFFIIRNFLQRITATLPQQKFYPRFALELLKEYQQNATPEDPRLLQVKGMIQKLER
jgi:hypothetical protein